MAWPSRCDRIFAAYPLAAGGIFVYQADLRAAVAAGPSSSKESIVKFQKHSFLTISQGMSSLERCSCIVSHQVEHYSGQLLIVCCESLRHTLDDSGYKAREEKLQQRLIAAIHISRAFVACGPPYESEN